MESRKTNSNAVAAFVFGILSIFIFGLILGFFGFVFYNRAMREINVTGEDGSGLATAGMILSILGVIRGILGAIGLFFFISI